MAAKTPVTQGTAGYPGANGVFGGVNPISTALITVGALHASVDGMKFRRYYFADIDDTDTWTSNIQGIVAVAWQADQVDADIVAATLTTAATGVITFDAQNANSNGWLWVLSRG